VRQIVADKQQSAVGSSNIVLVDVRSPEEVQGSGLIPFAVNIPVNAVGTVLQATFDADEFEDTFGSPKPDPDQDQLVFYCKSGARSAMACSLAEGMGFRGVVNYSGSWMDWAAQHAATNK
jgi:rhodanese-related sulfurtransferase